MLEYWGIKRRHPTFIHYPSIPVLQQSEINKYLKTHPNVEVRLFNPWRQYSSRRSVKAARTAARFNYRMHMKASVVDRSRVYIGSFNLDPRAGDFNTEMGVLIDSPELAEELARLAEELMQPENSWQVNLNDEGKLIWQAGNDIRTRQPAQSFWQRVMDAFFKLFPSKYF